MEHPGRNPFKGTNYQTLAALALFLQYLKIPAFLCIQLETPGSIDFTLVFADDHKIFCEAKDQKNGLRDSDLKKFVRNLLCQSESYCWRCRRNTADMQRIQRRHF